jgi:hypothetical protein
LIPASGLLLAGWQEMVTVAAVALFVLATGIWILSSDERTSRLTQLIRSFRKPPGQ